jgi:hypothetical protein
MTEVDMENLALRVRELEAWREVVTMRQGGTPKAESDPMRAYIQPGAVKAEQDKKAAEEAKELREEAEKKAKEKEAEEAKSKAAASQRR